MHPAWPAILVHGFPTLPYKNDGRRKFDIFTLQTDSSDGTAQLARARLAGSQEPIRLYAQGPYDWPALALRAESDSVLESSGVIGWETYMQMREAQLLVGNHADKEAAFLQHLRDSARGVAQGSLDADIWGTNKSRVFMWLETIMQDIAAAPRRVLPRCRVFKVGQRGDYQKSIRQAAQALNMCEARPDALLSHGSNGYDFYWGEQWERMAQYTDPRIRRTAIVGSVLGFMKSMGDKMALARLFSECLAGQRANSTHPQWCEFTKRGFNIGRQGKLFRGQHQQFREWSLSIRQENTFPQLWILKAQKSFNQVGISMLHIEEADVADDDSVLRWMNRVVPDGTWTLQEYVMNPALFQDRKFDMRVWAVITSVDPLRIVLCRKFMPKISTKRYSPEVHTKSDSCMHFKMPMGPECNKALLVHPYPAHTAMSAFYRGVRFARPVFDSAEAWNRLVVPQVERIIALTTLLARQEPLELHRQMQLAGSTYRRFQFLSPDFIVDNKGRVFLEEMNTNGFMPGDDVLYKMQDDTRSLLHLLGADGFPKRPDYVHRVEELLDRFCRDRTDCTDEGRSIILEVVDEEVHAFPSSWYRIYPSLFSSSHVSLQRISPLFSTSRDALLRDFLAYRADHL
uniref:Tubulin--tyrosine ligase-like protein 9 n=1 Tax=Haptolina ericina TaxID=156174 RepID=A0A7S3C5N6_9EUKA|mmetsp:Transcript_9699/g.21988  ORF Transcript_9699/g.21988 Transcript_9699/m.21988 type:complete len:627 (+) Transcript_9699:45-1925(+)|eukprot:CAMPEP_0181203530 /NCGR_PEP_ID=MMETSP1096-20121128/19438_1 /TAXON_ID=156174 ORGANISM="Chrysochromulina ericina, Strain CCMP281" /NCGR_SAMPLE_ID=MMETSP1096 /ASSEMBLY_ACC=CAM_ASM_000453 /LENGTH=626 /DNA_ID=CAMNT_0023294143 /DNA_START=45 /DNA_END=1925 /DNA_ORIENTATION=+